MTVIPSGDPAWARTANIGVYGGDVNKRNYLDRGAIDPLTDVDATQFARLTADLAAVTRTNPFAIIMIRLDDSMGHGAPVVQHARMAIGVRNVEYPGDTPPTFYPSCARNGNGDITVTFLSEYSDEYGSTAPFFVSHAFPQAIYGGAGGVVRAVYEVPTPQSVRVRMFDESGAPMVAPALPTGHAETPADGVLRLDLIVY